MHELKLITRPGVALVINWLGHLLSDSFVKLSSKHIHYQTVRARNLQFWDNVHHPPCVRCQISGVRSLLTWVMFHVALISFLHIFTESALWQIQSTSRNVCVCLCVSVCLCHRKTPSSGGRGDFWSNCVLLIFPCNDTIFFLFPFRLFWQIFF